jgi:class 3 adenylate cyclase/tetratricopeptide (TPR) repeat protein
MESPDSMLQVERLERAIASLEEQRALLGDIAVDAATAGLRAKLASIDSQPAPRGPAAPPAPGAAERKLVTVMFADISGFTHLSEKADPEHVHTLINKCFSVLVPIVEKYGGTVDKYIGDEIMALFGAPVEHENDAERALRAALEMLSALSQFNNRMGTELGMHFGINTGIVVAGGMGSESRQQYSVIGDTVNLASRLADASDTGEILAGPATWRLTRAFFDFDAAVRIEVKGKTDPVPVYRLQGLKKGPTKHVGLSSKRAPLVGRDRELLQLARLAELTLDGTGGVVAIVAEPGLGKSRLIAELRERLSEDICWVEARAQSHHEGWNHWLARSVLCSMIEISSEASAAEIALSLRVAIERLGNEVSADTYEYLARMLEISGDGTDQERLRLLKPEALRQRMWNAFRELLAAFCRVRPMAVVWEDLHWSDPASMWLLRFLLPLTLDLPLLMITTFRPHEGPASEWSDAVEIEFPGRMRRMELAALTEQDSNALLGHLLRIENLPDGARRAILTKSEGNPLFVEELFQSLVDAGLAAENGGASARRQLELLQASDTLQGVIGARIDRLQASQKLTLQAASVVGREFQQPVLSRILEEGVSLALVDDSLTDLERRDFILRKGAAEYIFKHAITQDVAYNTLLIARRRQLHQAVANAIESLFPESIDFAATLAYHYQEAGDVDRAVALYLLAAERAQKVFCNEEALDLLESALEQAQTLRAERIAVVQERLGDLLNLVGRHEEARRAYQAAMELIPDEKKLLAARLLRKFANSWLAQRYRTEEALAGLDSAERILKWESNPDHEDSLREWLDIQLDRWWVLYWLNRVDEMATLDVKIRELVLSRGTALQRAQLNRCRVLMIYRRDRYWVTQEVLDCCRDGLTASLQAGDIAELTHTQFVFGFSYMWKGELVPARQHLREAMALAERTGDNEWLVLSLTYLGVVARKTGDVAETTELAARVIEIALRTNMPIYAGVAYANYAWLAWKGGQMEAALAFGALALEKWAAVSYPVKWVAMWPLLAIERQRNGLESALAYARELLSPAQCRLAANTSRRLQEAVSAWDNVGRSAFETALDAAITAASSDGYL